MSGRYLKFSESGVRGIVGDSLTPLLAASLASSFGKYVGGGRVIIGRDTRATGEMLEHAVVAGLLGVGCQPVILGIVPTPTVQMMVGEYRANGGIAITASHNPAEWNALKFIGRRGMFLDSREAPELFDIYTQGDLTYSNESDIRDIRRENRAFERHMRAIFNAIDVDLIKSRRLRVAVDCCNGVGALYSRKFLEALGCEVFACHETADGNFERPPEPLAENLGRLCDLVRDNDCVIGFAHDPDGDRMALVDNTGKALGVQATVAMAVEHLLSENPGPVAVNIQTTRAVEDIAESYGCEVHYSKVGEINVVDKMLECGAEIGGEGNSSGVIWRRVHPGRDSYVAMALMLEMLSGSSESPAEIYASLPRYCNKSRKFNCGAHQSREIILELARRYEQYELITLDGLRINFADSWALVRSSNTEPALRLTAEALEQRQVDQMLETFSQEITELLG